MGFRHPAVWIALILLIIVLFGASKLPDITRNVGKSLKIFKEEVRDLREDTDTTPPPGAEHNPPQPLQHPPTNPADGPARDATQPPQAPNPNLPTDPQ